IRDGAGLPAERADALHPQGARAGRGPVVHGLGRAGAGGTVRARLRHRGRHRAARPGAGSAIWQRQRGGAVRNLRAAVRRPVPAAGRLSQNGHSSPADRRHPTGAMRQFASLALVGLVLAPGAVRAADGPVLVPTRDVAVTYRMDAGGRMLEQRMRWSAAAKRMRVDPPTPGIFVLIDYVAHRMEVVREPERSFVEMAAPATL